MRGNHFAPQHTSTIFTDDPKAVVEERWLKSKPGCTIVYSTVRNGTAEIVYTKDVEVEAARLANEQPDVCIGSMYGNTPDSRSKGSNGI